MKKTFVLDTNVILSDPRCLYKFEDNIIHIPLIVIEELDGLKKGHDEKARNAREFSRTVDALRALQKLSRSWTTIRMSTQSSEIRVHRYFIIRISIELRI